MTKLHISLVGGQPMPSYLGIIDDMPDDIILIYSSKSERQANIITKTIQLTIGKKCRKIKFNAFDIVIIKEQLIELENELIDFNSVNINLSSGSKPWSILFYDYFKMNDKVNCLYVDQNNNVINLQTNESHKIKHTPSWENIFALNETKVKNKKMFIDFTEEDHRSVKDIKTLRYYAGNDFKKITDELANDKKHSSQKIRIGNLFISWNKTTNTYSCDYSSYKEKIKMDISSPNVTSLMLNTGWFELEVATFLSQWSLAKEIWLNCEFTTTQSLTQDTKNEIDIIINTGDKLLFVECKTQVHQITDVDKFNNAVRTYGGLAAKRLFITDEKMKKEAAEKCTNYEMLYYSLQELKNNPNKAQDFFDKLTAEMSESNKK